MYNIDSDGEADAVGEASTDEEQEPTTALATIPDKVPEGSIKLTPRIAPTFDGQSSWFEFEDLIDDWVGITTLPQEKLGPSLKNSLVGAAEYYKNMLDNSILRDPDRGIIHFKDILKPYFAKGVNDVFLWRWLHAAVQDLARTFRRVRSVDCSIYGSFQACFDRMGGPFRRP